MKRVNLVLSLASVILLTSCNSKGSNALDPCNEKVANQVGAAILDAQTKEQDYRLKKLYPYLYNYMPTSVKKYTSVINYTIDNEASFGAGLKEHTSQNIHKVCSIDLDKMCYTCDYEETRVGLEQTLNTQSKYYLFFVLDEVQEKDVKEENRLGTIYQLAELNGAKRCLNKIYEPSGAYATTYKFFMDMYMMDAISAGATSPAYSTFDYSCNDYLNDNQAIIKFTDELSLEGTSWNNISGGIYQQDVIENLIGTTGHIANWATVHALADLEEDSNVFFNPSYGSNDPRSLSINLDGQLKVEIKVPLDPTTTDTITYIGSNITKRYIEFKDLYCTTASFDNVNDLTAIKFNDVTIENAYHRYKTHMDRTNQLGVAKCSIPTDIDQYIF